MIVMKSVFNNLSCLGFILLLCGGVFLTAVLMGAWGLGALIIGAVLLFIGLLLIFVQYKISGAWNKVVDIIKSHEKITIQEASGLSGFSPEGVRSIIYEAIALGDLSGTLDEDTFSREK